MYNRVSAEIGFSDENSRPCNQSTGESKSLFFDREINLAAACNDSRVYKTVSTHMPDDETSWIGYYSAAKDYLEAAKVIWISPVRHSYGLSKFFLPTHMLLGFSLELYFKAWLRFEGISSNTLSKRTYGHNLQNLYDEANRHGFPVIVNQSELVAHLATEHTAFGYRYMKDNHNYIQTNLPVVFPIFDTIDDLVDTHIGASTDISHAMKIRSNS